MEYTHFTNQSMDDSTALVSAAIGEDAPSIIKMLEVIARRMEMFGCGLWEIAPGADLDARPPKGRLVTVAAWWESGEMFALDDVPLDDSPTAKVAVLQQPKTCRDIQVEGGKWRSHPFWKKYNLRGMCAVPLVLHDGTRAALNVYRRGAATISEFDTFRLTKMAQVVPALIRVVRETVGLNLVSDVDKILREADRTSSQQRDAFERKHRKPLSMRRVQGRLKEVCDTVSAAFDCVETSIFLEDPEGELDSYKIAATTDKKSVLRSVYRLPQDRGRLTGWVLDSWKPVRIFDLTKLGRDAETNRRLYPGLERFDSTQDIADARKRLKLRSNDELPRLSFMAAPIFGGVDLFGGADLRGVIRCQMTKSSPYYFLSREQNLLEVIAAQVGRWWAAWRTHCDLKKENDAWNKLVSSLGTLNSFVREELGKERPDEVLILRKTLNITTSLIPGAELNGVRLHNPINDELYFAAFSEKAEQALTAAGKRIDKLRRFPIKTPARYAGVKVFVTGKPYVMFDVHSDHHYSPIFNQVKRMIVVPIGVGDDRYGVLDLRWTKKDIPPHAMPAASLIGQQLGLYHQLALLVAEVRRSAGEVEAQKLLDVRVYEDFAHQLKNPVTLAKIRSEWAVEKSRSPEDIPRLVVVRGLCRRARRAAMSMRLFSNLSKNCSLPLQRLRVEKDRIIKMLIEMSDDTQLFAASRGLAFHVERDGLLSPQLNCYSIDYEMLEQMMNNLLDNAAKYSSRNSTIRVFGGVSRAGRFFLAVANKGIQLREGEVEKCKERGWRSLEARLSTNEGSGIGLWLVDQIMRAHNGLLEINPRNGDGMTEIRLSFSR
jgi:signal transduction histidine kinase